MTPPLRLIESAQPTSGAVVPPRRSNSSVRPGWVRYGPAPPKGTYWGQSYRYHIFITPPSRSVGPKHTFSLSNSLLGRKNAFLLKTRVKSRKSKILLIQSFLNAKRANLNFLEYPETHFRLISSFSVLSSETVRNY